MRVPLIANPTFKEKNADPDQTFKGNFGSYFRIQILWVSRFGSYRIRIRNISEGTLCTGSRDPFYIVSYYINWVTTSWTHSTVPRAYEHSFDRAIKHQRYLTDFHST